MAASASDIPSEFYDALRRRVESHVKKGAFNKGCWQWTGCLVKPGGYGRVHLTVKGDEMGVTSHRASYIAFKRMFILPHDISHRCHEKLCVNPDHLSHEPHSINLRRRACKQQTQCRGHGQYKSCIF